MTDQFYVFMPDFVVEVVSTQRFLVHRAEDISFFSGLHARFCDGVLRALPADAGGVTGSKRPIARGGLGGDAFLVSGCF